MKKITSLLVLCLGLYAFGKDIAIIVNKNNPVNELSKIDLRRIYLSDTQKWEDGKPIVTLTLSADAGERKTFQDKVLGMSNDELQKYMSDQEIKGKSVKSATVQKSSQALQLFVGKVPMAIGFIYEDEFKDDGKIRIIKIDGKLPGEGGYPLK